MSNKIVDNRKDKCVHTEHCCSIHGCKYADDDCPVFNMGKVQSYPCEECNEDNNEHAECNERIADLEHEIARLKAAHARYAGGGEAEYFLIRTSALQLNLATKKTAEKAERVGIDVIKLYTRPTQEEAAITSAMKAEHMGEYFVEVTEYCSECSEDDIDYSCEVCDGQYEYSRSIDIPWTTIKEIFKGMYKSMLTASKEGNP